MDNIQVINEFFGNYTLLHYACNTRTDELIKALIEKGANINCVTSDTQRASPLQLYLSSDDNSLPSAYIVKLLCSIENVDYLDTRGYTALFYATKGWWHNDLFPEIISVLLTYGAKSNPTILVNYCTNNFREGCKNNAIYYEVAEVLLNGCGSSSIYQLREIAIKNKDIQLYSILNKIPN